jgi:hypothetical protein
MLVCVVRSSILTAITFLEDEMSQPCSAVELVLFDARDLANPATRADVEAVVMFGVLTGAVLDSEHVADVVKAEGQSDRLGFWFGGAGDWPFERAIAFANVDPGRVLFVSRDPSARQAAATSGVRLYDLLSGDITALLP